MLPGLPSLRCGELCTESAVVAHAHRFADLLTIDNQLHAALRLPLMIRLRTDPALDGDRLAGLDLRSDRRIERRLGLHYLELGGGLGLGVALTGVAGAEPVAAVVERVAVLRPDVLGSHRHRGGTVDHVRGLAPPVEKEGDLS